MPPPDRDNEQLRDEVFAIVREWGLKEEQLKKLPAMRPAADELHRLVTEAVERSPIPAEARKSVIVRLYEALAVMGTLYGAWEAVKALYIFLSSFTMSAEVNKTSTQEHEEFVEAARMLEPLPRHPDLLKAMQQLNALFEQPIVRGLVDHGMDSSTARFWAARTSLLIQRDVLTRRSSRDGSTRE